MVKSQLSVMIAASLHVNHLSPLLLPSLSLSFFVLGLWAVQFYHHGPFIRSSRCPVIETFIEMIYDNSCKCANWRLTPGLNVKPSKGIRKWKVGNAAHSHVMYHRRPSGHSWLCFRVQPRTCHIIKHLSTQDTICSSLMTFQKSVFITFLKGKWMCKYISHANSFLEHMLRQLCDYNQAACEKCLVWRLLLDLSLSYDSADLKSHPR